MMSALSWPSIAFYSAFGVFVFYQQLHVRDFRGGSQTFLLALNLSALMGIAVGLVYLVYYGWTVAWWAPVPIFIIGLAVSSILGVVVERVVGAMALSLAGFLGWPVCAYFMFSCVPSGFR